MILYSVRLLSLSAAIKTLNEPGSLSSHKHSSLSARLFKQVAAEGIRVAHRNEEAADVLGYKDRYPLLVEVACQAVAANHPKCSINALFSGYSIM